MTYVDLDPLYKLLCWIIVFLVPLVPAWALFKIAPEGKFLAIGDFTGFKINASGAAAIYIVLFAALYLKTDGIINKIDSTEKLLNTITTLKNNRPWKVRYQITLMGDDPNKEITPRDYAKYFDRDSIVCFSPEPMQLNNDSKNITFYVDNVDFNSDTIHGQIIMRNGYGSPTIDIPKAAANVNDKTILVKAKFLKTKSNLDQLLAINKGVVPVLKITKNSNKPPIVSNSQ